MKRYAVVGDNVGLEWGTELSDRVTETDIVFFDAGNLDDVWKYVEAH